MKPCKQSEIDFYESIRSHPAFSAFVPAYLGTLALGESQSAQAVGAIVLPAETRPDSPAAAPFAGETVIEKQWTPSNGGKIQTDLAIVLENVAVDFNKPNILDVKLGARLWADDAPPAKRARLDKAAEETTSKPLGFRIAGMKTYRERDSAVHVDMDADGYRVYDKNYGRSLNADTVHQGFEEFFLLTTASKATGSLRKVIRRFVDDLQAMAEAIEHEESRMYSASLLFVYEGNGPALDEAFAKEKEVLATLKSRREIDRDGVHVHPGERPVDPDKGDLDNEGEAAESEEEDEAIKFPAIESLKLIDFAHAQWTPGQGPDENILQGIRNVARIMTDLAG